MARIVSGSITCEPRLHIGLLQLPELDAVIHPLDALAQRSLRAGRLGLLEEMRDVVARFGGEEFLILLPGTRGPGALIVAEQIRTAFSKVHIRHIQGEEETESISISIGVAVPAPAEPIQRVIERADQALYQAKNDGRNRVCVSPGST